MCPPPPLQILIVADGDDALRLFKRVGCASHALGVELAIEERKGGGDRPRVFIDGALLIEGLPRTEAIQAKLAQWLAARREAELTLDPGGILPARTDHPNDKGTP